MQIEVTGGELAAQEVDTLVVQIADRSRRLSGAAAEVDAALGGTIAGMLSDGLIRGRSGELTTLPTGGKLAASASWSTGWARGTGSTSAATATGLVTSRARCAGLTRSGSRSRRRAPAGHRRRRARRPAPCRGLHAWPLPLRQAPHEAADRPRGEVSSLTIVEGSSRRAAGVGRGVERGRRSATARI